MSLFDGPRQKCEYLTVKLLTTRTTAESVKEQIQFMCFGVIIMHEERCCLGWLRAYAALRVIQQQSSCAAAA